MGFEGGDDGHPCCTEMLVKYPSRNCCRIMYLCMNITLINVIFIRQSEFNFKYIFNQNFRNIYKISEVLES